MSRSHDRADAIDKRVGERIRALRNRQGLSQSDLATLTGVTYQQVHKYERGFNRLSAGRAAVMAEALGVPVGALFEAPDAPAAASDGDKEHLCMQAARRILGIANPRRREAVLSLISALAEE